MSTEKVFRIEEQGQTLIVVPHGDGLGFRYNDVQLESNLIRGKLAQPQYLHLVIDLGELDYFGSEVIGVLISMAREAKTRGGTAVMCNASDKMRQVMTNMRLFQLWPHFNSRDEALKAVNA